MKTIETNRTNRNATAVRAAAFEALEQRQMMSVSWNAGALSVVGTNANDTIVVDYQDMAPGFSMIRVRENGAVTQNWVPYQNAKGLTVYGNAGNDTIDLSAVKFGATVHGGTGDDTIKGTQAGDTLNGNEDNDTIYGNGGADTINGNDGDDALVGGAGADQFFGGTGVDTVSYAERTSPVIVAIDGVGLDGEAGEFDNVMADVENLVGGTNADWLTGTDAANRIEGNGGSDVIHGGGGNDTLFGGMASYTSPDKNNNGTDQLFGDAGDDQLWAGWAGRAVMHGGADHDILFGGKLADDLYGDSGGGTDNLWGGMGENELNGGDGDDVLVSVGGSEQDAVYGDAGKDTFWVDNTDEDKDATQAEVDAGRVHRVDHYEMFRKAVIVGGQVTTEFQAVAKDPLGQNLPDPAVPAGTKWANFSDSPLFGLFGPTPDDVVQGKLGDCWYASSLSAVARKNPGHLRNHIVPLGDGTYAVEFFQGTNTQYVRIDADLPVDGGGDLIHLRKGSGGSIWAALYEKAEAFHHTDVSSYAMIDGGNPMTALEELGGREAGQLFWTAADGPMSEPNLLKTIDGLLKQGNVVEYSTTKDAPASGVVVKGHAYSVVAVNKDANGKLVSLTLRNPWGEDGTNGDGPNDGYITLTAHEAWLGVNAISFAKF